MACNRFPFHARQAVRHLTRVIVAAALCSLVLVPGRALAQENTGTITGVVTEAATGKKLAGVTVVVSGPKMMGEQAEITDDTGSYTITTIPPGPVVVRFYYADQQVEKQTSLNAGKTIRVNAQVGAAKEIIEVITQKVHAVDVASTKRTTVMDKQTFQNEPQRTREVEGAMEKVAGAQVNQYGVSVGGATSVENNYMVDGVNVTSIGYGQLGTSLSTDFIAELEVITGGYNAEYGRATGGIVSVVTKSGSNEFHGDFASYYEPGFLHAPRDTVSNIATAIRNDLSSDPGDYNLDFFADLGGPIVKDRLWFYAGVEPQLSKSTVNRMAIRPVDLRNDVACQNRSDPACSEYNPDGGQDYIDGAFQEQMVGDYSYENTGLGLQWVTKLNLLVTPDHTLDIVYLGNPVWNEVGYGFGTPTARFSLQGGGQDISAHWISKLFDHKWQLEGMFNYHRETSYILPANDDGNFGKTSVFWAAGPTLNQFAAERSIYPGLQEACNDDPRGLDDPFPRLTNCPATNYFQGGIGFADETLANRYALRLIGTNFFQALGHHQVKYGYDPEFVAYNDQRTYTGTQGQITIGNTGDPSDEQVSQFFTREALTGNPFGLLTTRTETRTINNAAFLQDTWQIYPNLIINAGVRWERQDLGDLEGNTQLTINNNWAPRLGIIFDPSNEGRAKIFASYARFYESIPMDINNRTFGREGTLETRFNSSSQTQNCRGLRENDNVNGVPIDPIGTITCPFKDDPTTLTAQEGSVGAPTALGGRLGFVMPDLQGQYKNEYAGGVEYEVIEDLTVGLDYTYSNLGMVVEDASVDWIGGTVFDYFIVNPGEKVTQEQLDGIVAKAKDLEQQADAAEASGRAGIAKDLRDQAAGYTRFRILAERFNEFPKAQRDYHAATLKVGKRFSNNWQLLASYTYSRLLGNYPGLFSPDTGQLDPNITSQFDLPSLMPNRDGFLPGNRSNSLKIDGFYYFDLAKLLSADVGSLGLGTSLRWFSGSPSNTLGAHLYYGRDEAYVLPRGTGAGTPNRFAIDLQLNYKKSLSKQVTLQISMQFFNLVDKQEIIFTDETYTYDAVNPIVNGTQEDLKHLKLGYPTGNAFLATKNSNFGNYTVKQAPFFSRLGALLTF